MRRRSRRRCHSEIVGFFGSCVAKLGRATEVVDEVEVQRVIFDGGNVLQGPVRFCFEGRNNGFQKDGVVAQVAINGDGAQ